MRRVSYGTVGIVGLGLIGASIGLRLRGVGAAKRVIGFDVSPSARADAVRMGAVDASYETLNHLGDADILVLAVPPDALIPCLIEADVFCKVNSIVTDTSSVKGYVLEWLKTYPLRFGPRFVGGHPMAGNEGRGAADAKADLFEGRSWVLTPTQATDKSAYEAVHSLVLTLGAKPLTLTPEEHDRHAAILSHLPHAIAAILAQMGANLVHPEVAGSSWNDLTRVAGSNPDLWANIFTTNRHEVASALEDFEFMLSELKKAVNAEQHQTLLEFFQAAARAKTAWRN
ncbi:MAG: prephenate dehydrogenase/arogenate dehydrogenase family protein [Armatimonadetes bacterium]|nr:prephenate dehydrogenase/arogenate dehydrogenase family protein [Armatimonadota bacterium]